MNTNIKEVRVWKNKNDVRVYVHTTDRREGVLYLTGNKWNAAGSVDGKLTPAEWDAAKSLAFRCGEWTTMYEDDIRLFSNSASSARNANKTVEFCHRCGGRIEPRAGHGEYISAGNTDEGEFDEVYAGRAGWYYYHSDSAACDAERSARKAEQEREREREHALDNEAAALSSTARQATGLSEKWDLSFDDDRFTLLEVIAESEHYVARKYACNGEVIGFVIKEK